MNILYLLDLTGTIAFAASGAWAGVRRRMDLFGVIVLGLVTAVGGGTLRDLLLGNIPPFSLLDETYAYLSIVTALAVFVGHRKIEALERPLLYFDAVGLGTFVVIGTSKALFLEMGFLTAVLMGLMTGTAGGIIRDVLANQVPLIPRKEIYASACVAGAVILVLLDYLGATSAVSAMISACTVITIRVLAIHYHWSLPRARD